MVKRKNDWRYSIELYTSYRDKYEDIQDPAGDHNYYHTNIFKKRIPTEPESKCGCDEKCQHKGIEQSNPQQQQQQQIQQPQVQQQQVQRENRNDGQRDNNLPEDSSFEIHTEDANTERLTEAPLDTELGSIYDEYFGLCLVTLVFLILLFGLVMEVIPYPTVLAFFWLIELRGLQQNIKDIYYATQCSHKKQAMLSSLEFLYAAFFQVTSIIYGKSYFLIGLSDRIYPNWQKLQTNIRMRNLLDISITLQSFRGETWFSFKNCKNIQ